MKVTKKNCFILILILITLLAITTTVVVLLRNDSTPAVYYPPILEDTNKEPLPDTDDAPLSNPAGGGAVSLAYSKIVTAEQGNRMAAMLFGNPKKSNQSIMVEIQITDKVLLEKLGKTGRTAEDVAKIEQASNYDSQTARVTIAQSGLIKPGFQIKMLQLNALPDGTVLPAGEYEANYYVLAYDDATNERAIINTQIPITLIVEQ